MEERIALVIIPVLIVAAPFIFLFLARKKWRNRMIDKVQKIRKEVARIQLYAQSEVLKQVLDYIDEVQKEPVGKVWHDSNEEPNNMSHCLIFYGDKSLIGHYLHYEPVLYNKQDKVFVTVAYPHPTGYKVEQKSLDGGCVTEAYKDKRERISISDITSWCYLNDLHNLTQKEEPVSEELEEAASSFARKDSEGISNPADFYYTVADKTRIFKAGAKWQEKKDQSTIELAEDHAMLAGMEKMEERMMAKAIDGYVIEDIEEGNGDFLLSAEYLPKSMGLKDQQKVKVILIKGEEI